MDKQNDWTRDALMEAKNYLFNYLGKPFVYRDFDFISGKGRKLDYSDLDTAVSRMRSAFEQMAKDRGDISTAEPLILESIGIWERALGESNPADKKARINEDITASLQSNIALAYAWLRDFNKSREWGAKAVKVKDGQKLIQNVQGWIDDHEKRLAANELI